MTKKGQKFGFKMGNVELYLKRDHRKKFLIRKSQVIE